MLNIFDLGNNNQIIEQLGQKLNNEGAAVELAALNQSDKLSFLAKFSNFVNTLRSQLSEEEIASINLVRSGEKAASENLNSYIVLENIIGSLIKNYKSFLDETFYDKFLANFSTPYYTDTEIATERLPSENKSEEILLSFVKLGYVPTIREKDYCEKLLSNLTDEGKYTFVNNLFSLIQSNNEIGNVDARAFFSYDNFYRLLNREAASNILNYAYSFATGNGENFELAKIIFKNGILSKINNDDVNDQVSKSNFLKKIFELASSDNKGEQEIATIIFNHLPDMLYNYVLHDETSQAILREGISKLIIQQTLELEPKVILNDGMINFFIETYKEAFYQSFIKMSLATEDQTKIFQYLAKFGNIQEEIEIYQQLKTTEDPLQVIKDLFESIYRAKDDASNSSSAKKMLATIKSEYLFKCLNPQSIYYIIDNSLTLTYGSESQATLAKLILISKNILSNVPEDKVSTFIYLICELSKKPSYTELAKEILTSYDFLSKLNEDGKSSFFYYIMKLIGGTSEQIGLLKNILSSSNVFYSLDRKSLSDLMDKAFYELSSGTSEQVDTAKIILTNSTLLGCLNGEADFASRSVFTYKIFEFAESSNAGENEVARAVLSTLPTILTHWNFSNDIDQYSLKKNTLELLKKQMSNPDSANPILNEETIKYFVSKCTEFLNETFGDESSRQNNVEILKYLAKFGYTHISSNPTLIEGCNKSDLDPVIAKLLSKTHTDIKDPLIKKNFTDLLIKGLKQVMDSNKIIADILTITAGKNDIYVYESNPGKNCHGNYSDKSINIFGLPLDKLGGDFELSTTILANTIGTIVHESLHGALELIYLNECNPHLQSDEITQKYLTGIVKDLKALSEDIESYGKTQQNLELPTQFIGQITRDILSGDDTKTKAIYEKDPALVKWLHEQLFPVIARCAQVTRLQENPESSQAKLLEELHKGMGFEGHLAAETAAPETLILDLLGAFGETSIET